jgi:large subunit ribosomal protein L23
MIDPLKILKYPHVSEKSISLIERENKIVFVVDRKANKKQIKYAFEKMFDVKVESVNTSISPKGVKKAYIKLTPKYKAVDVATKLGMI